MSRSTHQNVVFPTVEIGKIEPNLTMRKPAHLLQFTQIAWVVKDLEKAKINFQNLLGITKFSATTTVELKEYAATYYGESSDAINLLAMAYSGGSFIELIQPVSGRSVFQDFIDEHPAGGVQHIAFSTSIIHLEEVIKYYVSRGYPVISSFDTPIAKIVFFDTRDEIGLMTEIMGITEEGEKAMEEMKK